jgi:hypothetical protein
MQEDLEKMRCEEEEMKLQKAKKLWFIFMKFWEHCCKDFPAFRLSKLPLIILDL